MLFRKKKLTILLSSTVRLIKLPISNLIASTTVEVLESIPFSSGTSGGRGEGGGGDERHSVSKADFPYLLVLRKRGYIASVYVHTHSVHDG